MEIKDRFEVLRITLMQMVIDANLLVGQERDAMLAIAGQGALFRSQLDFENWCTHLNLKGFHEGRINAYGAMIEALDKEL